MSGQEENNKPVVNRTATTYDSRVLRYTSSPGQKGIVILPMDEYKRRFMNRYENEIYFRDRVHKYLGVSRAQRVKLGIGEIFARSWYMKTTQQMINNYSQRVLDDLLKAKKLEDDLAKFGQMKAELEKQAVEVRVSNRQTISVERTFEEEKIVRGVAVKEKQQELGENLKNEEVVTEEAKQEVIRNTDVKEIVKVRLNEVIRSSSLVKVTKSGEIVFNEKNVMKKLEDILLDEVVAEIENEGYKDFMRKVQHEYEGFISHFEEMEDLNEISEVDWLESAILSRTKGFKYPIFPYLVSARYTTKETIKPTIDSAITVDRSGSMDSNNKFERARKAALALHAVERKVNPDNSVYLSLFAQDNLEEVTTRVMMDGTLRADGGTPAHLGLKWGLDKLRDSRCGVVYLVTDGAPDDVNKCVVEAKKYKECPHVMLRVFLIDGDSYARDNVRQIGRAAGPNTKVSCIESQDLAKGVIKDFADCIGQMKSIDSF